MAENEVKTQETEPNVEPNTEQETLEESRDGARTEASGDEIAALRAEIARQKEAINKATREAADFKRQLRAKQSAEEIAAEEQRVADEAKENELSELRREMAQIKTVKSVMVKLGTSEEVSTRIAERLYGAEDTEAALDEIRAAWAAKEKALRMEFGKIPAPGAGGSQDGNDEDKVVELAKTIGRERAGAGKPIKEALGGYVR